MHDRSQSLRRSLLATLAYFDLFEYPLTLVELRRFRYRFSEDDAPPDAAEVLAALSDDAIGERDGYYFLAGKGAIVDERRRRYRLAEKKFARARRVAAWMRLLPSVRLIAVCNSLAIANADERSDIDLFVVARRGTLWVTRLVAVGTLAIMGLRPAGEDHADKVCMSFFLSDNHLDISDMAQRPDDTYLRYWIATLVPIYDAGDTHAAFLAANAWISDRLPAVRRDPRPPGEHVSAGAVFRLLAAAEPFAKRLQERMFPAEIRDLAGKDTRVVVTDDVLKFHVNDRRQQFESLFRERLAALGIL